MLPCRGAGSTVINGGKRRREGEARGSLAEVKVNLPPAHMQKKARKEDKAGRQARRKDNPPLIAVR